MSYLRCFSTLGCPELALDEVFALAARYHVGAVELRALDGTIDLPLHFATHFGSPEGLARAARMSAVRVVALDGSLHLIGHGTREREQLVALVPWAEALGVSHLRVFDGGRPGEEAGLNEAIASLRWWRNLRREHGWKVDLMVETHDSLLTAAAVGRLVAAAPDVAILWDAHHTWKKGGEDPLVTWQALRPRVVHVHVKDSVGVAGAHGKFHYVMPGQGEFPFAALIAALRADGFAGPVSLEWERLWLPELGPLEDVLAAMDRTQVW